MQQKIPILMDKLFKHRTIIRLCETVLPSTHAPHCVLPAPLRFAGQVLQCR